MSLRIEQNWKGSNKTFPQTLCVVSTSVKLLTVAFVWLLTKTCTVDQGGNFEHIVFLLALRFWSKLNQDVNISPFVNHFMLKNPRALDTFLHANQMKMYTWDKIVNFWQLFFAAIFLLNNVIGAMLSKNVGWFL